MKKITIIFSFLVFMLGGCSDFLDVNENPNFPLVVEDYLILPASQVSVASVFSADYGLIGSFWAQHWAQNNTSSQYKSFETYTVSSGDGIVNFSYRELYRDGLADNEIIRLQALEEENWGLYLMTSTLKAFAFQYLVDLYGNVPYDDAFKGESDAIFNPVINNGEYIYAEIYDLLNEALDHDFDDFVDSRYEDYDLLLGADIDAWTEFANTLKLRILLRQYDANTAWATTELTDLLNNGTFLSDDVLFTNFEDADSKSNPMYESDQRQLNTSNNVRANATFTTFLKANVDARLGALFTTVDGNIFGMITGSYEVPSTRWEAPDLIAQPKFTVQMAISLMTVAESELLQAEAELRLNGAAAAVTNYNDGVAASFDRMGADGTGMTDAGGAYEFPLAGTFDEQLEAIIIQKWIDAAEGQRGIEAHIERVRTGYPVETQVNSSIPTGYELDLPATYIPGTLMYSKLGATNGNFPVRLPYADAELNYNSNAAEYAGLSDADVMQSKVWWNK